MYDIPKGTAIIVFQGSIMNNQKYWTNPNQFDPDRFYKERAQEINPSSWQAFGDGPRKCIGLRFAQLEAKLCLAKLLLNYRLVAGPSTQSDLSLEVKALTLNPEKGVFVKAVKI